MRIPAKKGINKPYVYKTPDLCKFMGVSRITVWSWEKKGWLTSPRNSHGDRMFTVEQMSTLKRRLKKTKLGWHYEDKNGSA
jgi:DNA-binding transcriptional MerR regulator